MRYYDIRLEDSSGSVVKSWSSMLNGFQNGNAQDVEFDLFVYDAGTPMGDSSITIWGVSLQDVGQNFNFGPSQQNPVGYNIYVRAGMGGGLPLENPAQAGLVFSGNVWQAWGNWIGTDMNIGFIAKGSPFTMSKPGNFVFSWKPGASLSQAISTTLQTAVPDAAITVNIKDSAYTTAAGETGVYSTLPGFAQRLKALTMNPPNVGVSIVGTGNRIFVFDGSYSPKVVQLAFTDFIGQPTWINQYQIQITLVMRGDISVGDLVTMPKAYAQVPGLGVAGPTSYASYRDQTVFQGQFLVTAMRHVGRFRDPDGAAWVTILQCAAYVPV